MKCISYILLSASLIFNSCTITPSARQREEVNSCDKRSCTSEYQSNGSEMKDSVTALHIPMVERIDTCHLMLLFPNYSRIDLICKDMPSSKDTSVILCAEACFTGQCLKEFDHLNIAGDHVSASHRYHGYRCNRNTGAFVWHGNKWEFLYKEYSKTMDEASKMGGAAFAQEMIIHHGKLVASIRKDSNKNQFRALCEIDGRLCIAESDSVINYGEYKSNLLKCGTREALYLDMGGGWNHAWYRIPNDSVKVLHPKTHDYCTNWITFYK